MKQKKFTLVNYFKTKASFNNILLLEGLLVGVFAGLVGCAYRFLLQNAETVAYTLSKYAQKGLPYVIGLFAILGVLGVIISLLLKYEPYIAGSGIPQVEAEMIDKVDEKWWRVILAKMVAGTLCICGGLSLGREGPTIQLGAMVGKGISKIFKRIRVEEKFLLTCGAAAGLSAAFNAPLAGVLFALEEVHKNFSPMALVSVMVASLTGDFISKNMFGMTPSLYFPLIKSLPLSQYGYLIILGIVTGLFGAFYNKITVITLELFDKIHFLKKNQKIYIGLFISGLFMIFYPDVLCGGHHIVEIVREGNVLMTTLIMLLTFKFIFSMLSFGCGAPGGIFFPLLVLGTLVGSIFATVMTQCFGVDQMYFNNYVVVAMAGLFAGIVRAPITGVVLIAEMCGSLSQFLPIAICAFMGYVVANNLKSEPIYHSLLHRLVKGQPSSENIADKTMLHYSLEVGSCCLGMAIKDIGLPKGCLIVTINRGIDDIVPRGDTVLMVGDYLSVLVDKDNIEVTKDILHKFFSIEYE